MIAIGSTNEFLFLKEQGCKTFAISKVGAFTLFVLMH